MSIAKRFQLAIWLPAGIAALALPVSPSLFAAELPARQLNFNADWRFMRADVTGAQRPDFDASQWSTVSCPHTWNDVDTFTATGAQGVPCTLWGRTNPAGGAWTALGSDTVMNSPFVIQAGGAASNATRFYRFSTP